MQGEPSFSLEKGLFTNSPERVNVKSGFDELYEKEDTGPERHRANSMKSFDNDLEGPSGTDLQTLEAEHDMHY